VLQLPIGCDLQVAIVRAGCAFFVFCFWHFSCFVFLVMLLGGFFKKENVYAPLGRFSSPAVTVVATNTVLLLTLL
jgi:hypothetical protein